MVLQSVVAIAKADNEITTTKRYSQKISDIFEYMAPYNFIYEISHFSNPNMEFLTKRFPGLYRRLQILLFRIEKSCSVFPATFFIFKAVQCFLRDGIFPDICFTVLLHSYTLSAIWSLTNVVSIRKLLKKISGESRVFHNLVASYFDIHSNCISNGYGLTRPDFEFTISNVIHSFYNKAHGEWQPKDKYGTAKLFWICFNYIVFLFIVSQRLRAAVQFKDMRIDLIAGVCFREDIHCTSIKYSFDLL